MITVENGHITKIIHVPTTTTQKGNPTAQTAVRKSQKNIIRKHTTTTITRTAQTIHPTAAIPIIIRAAAAVKVIITAVAGVLIKTAAETICKYE